MDFSEKRYVIGIDLGTTNSAVSFVDLNAVDKTRKLRPIKIFRVPQLTGPGEFSPYSVLPSFLYIPGEYDVSGDSIKHPWKREKDSFPGVFAREHGAAIPSRLVSSAKSWLCHARADRQARILPWGAEGVEKISPVEATAEFLRHIKKAWNHFIKDEDSFLENQFTVLTVPASFDESAREFTLEAARQAGLGNGVTLLEEPLAAFYSWLARHEHDWQNHVKPDDLILVCDVGGGTTDFTLITLRESEGSPRFERLAVGDHLILGGDNIDLALARYVETKFSGKRSLSADKWKTLCHKSRAAKERIFESGDDAVRITLKGEGRSVIAGTLSADLTRKDMENILCQGFFPDADPSQDVRKKSGKAMAEFGLPYEQEPAITRHIGWFLENHRQEVRAELNKDPMPDLILFNGGTLKPILLQDRIRGSIRNWFGETDTDLPVILENSEPDLSVALGASYYGLVKQGIGVRVGSGSPRSYYVGISSVGGKENNASEKKMDEKALCIVERGLDEGSLIALPKMAFEVLTNQPVTFNMYSSSFRSGDKSGDLVVIDDSLTPMPSLQTIVKFGKKGERSRIPVAIEPEYTEMGTLTMWCRSNVSSHRWKLQFQLRENAAGETPDKEVFEEGLVQDACALIDECFSRGCEFSQLAGIVKKVESLVNKKKNNWPFSFLRAMGDRLISCSDARMLSPEHEVRWLNLTGFCLRPGFGDAFDQERIKKLWKIYLSGPAFPKAKQNAIEWWIFCRRIAGGLSAGQQRLFYQDVSIFLLSKKNDKKRVSPQERIEIWMAAANMERLLVKNKVALGKKLITQLKPGKTPKQFFWVLSRLGAREMLYGSVDRVVSSTEVTNWVKKIMKMNWKRTELPYPAVAQMLRKTDDRTRDIPREFVDIVLTWFKKDSVDPGTMKMLQERVPIESREESQIFGETLPQGLVLKK